MRGKYSSDPGFLSQFAPGPFATRKKSFRASTKNAVISFVEACRAESRVRIARFHFQTEMPIESSTSAISHWRVHGNRVRLDPVWIHPATVQVQLHFPAHRHSDAHTVRARARDSTTFKRAPVSTRHTAGTRTRTSAFSRWLPPAHPRRTRHAL